MDRGERLKFLARKARGLRERAEVAARLEDVVPRSFKEDDFLDLAASDAASRQFSEDVRALEAGDLRPKFLAQRRSGTWPEIEEVVQQFASQIGDCPLWWFHEDSDYTGAVAVRLKDMLTSVPAAVDPEGADLRLFASDGHAGLRLSADDCNGHAPIEWDVVAWIG